MRANLHQLIAEHCHDVHDLETLLDKIEQIIASQPKVPLNVRISELKRDVFAWNHKNKEKYSTEMLTSFLNLWCRIEKNGNLKAENEKNFKIGGRLATFARMNKQFEKKSSINQFRQHLGTIDPLR